MRPLALPALTATVLVTFFAACVGDDPAGRAEVVSSSRGSEDDRRSSEA